MRSALLLSAALLALASSASAGPVFRARPAVITALAAVEQPIVSGRDTLLAIVPDADGGFTLRSGKLYRTTRPIREVESDLATIAAKSGTPFVFLTVQGRRYATNPNRTGIGKILDAARSDANRRVEVEDDWLYVAGRLDTTLYARADDERETWAAIGLREVK